MGCDLRLAATFSSRVHRAVPSVDALARAPPLLGVKAAFANRLHALKDEALVSTDFETCSISIFGSMAGIVLYPTFVKLAAWHVNVWDFLCRVVDLFGLFFTCMFWVSINSEAHPIFNAFGSKAGIILDPISLKLVAWLDIEGGCSSRVGVLFKVCAFGVLRRWHFGLHTKCAQCLSFVLQVLFVEFGSMEGFRVSVAAPLLAPCH
ncbi:unnamed protein product [Prorocentrum cordatum]|uniref:Solute carrier family 40 protein n=1 Tax=Prorocentrum cordatum TaxID=2364126 RepID=A0ABN9TZ22_9DINO|nr:unnamed protein product [Polarella glacialis]